MQNQQLNSATPDKKLAAACGLFCQSCTFFIGSTEEPERLQILSARFGRTVEEMTCYGCRSDKRSVYCDKYCKMTKCTSEKGIDFCGECSEYPCQELKTFQAQMPHRIELWEAHQRIREVGFKTWYTEMVAHYSCPKCHTINSAYDLKCRKCGAEPSCSYVRQHKDEVRRALGKMG